MNYNYDYDNMDLEEKKEYPLFLINGSKVDKISGPVFCTYLVPNESVFETYRSRNIFLPLFLFFGDVHASIQNMCRPCEQSDGCYRIYDKELLQLLDTLSTDKNPVDFYVETFSDEQYDDLRYYVSKVSREEILNKHRTPMNLLMFGDTEICFKRTKRGTVEYEEKCPTKNIRWHYSDPRQNFKFIEGNLFLISDYIEEIDNKNHESNREFLEKIRFIDQIKEVLLKLSYNNDKKINILKFSEYMLNSPNITKISVIHKQIKKQSYFLNKLWVKGLAFLIQDRLQFLGKYNSLNIDKDIYEDNIDIVSYSELVRNMDNSEYIKQYKKIHQQSFYTFISLIQNILASLLDIYFITRVLKGYGQQSSSLVVSYLGVNHTVYIIKLLKKLFNYDTKFEAGSDMLLNFFQPIRCLSSLSFIGGVQESIDLTQDLLEHNHKRIRKCADCSLMFKPYV